MTATHESAPFDDRLPELASRAEWPPSEALKTCTEDDLRCLDERGYLEFRGNCMGWYSPAAMPWVGGVLSTALKQGFPLRVSEKGKARLTELRVRAGKRGKGRRPGRPPDTDPKKDAQIAQAWGTAQHKTLGDLATALGMKEREVYRALDRHRHREARRVK